MNNKSNSFFKIIIELLLKSIYYLQPKASRDSCDSYLSRLSRIVYSKWISLKFNRMDLRFIKPVNYLRGCQYFKIGSNTAFGRLIVLTAWDEYEGEHFTPQIIIGDNCNFGDYNHLTCIDCIKIGNGCLTGRWVTISDNNHGTTSLKELSLPPIERKLHSKGPVTIGDNVWIGDKATILAGVSIGDGAIVAANAVVTKSIPPYAVAAGNPAQIINQTNL